MFSESLSKNKSYFIVVEGNNKDEFNAFILELDCEQMSLYSVLIISTQKYGPSDLPIRRSYFHTFKRGRKIFKINNCFVS